MEKPANLFDSALLKARRNRIASQANDHAFLLERVAHDFQHRLSAIKRDFPIGINLGAYHGVLSRELRPLENINTLFDIEPSYELANLCDGPSVCAYDDILPFANGTLDIVTSGLSLHLANDLPGALIQIYRALKPDGLFLAAMLGGTTLHELRQAWLIAEDEIEGGASPRVAPFADMRDIGALLQRAGFALPVVDTDRVHVTYESPLALMRELKAMGASNMLNDRTNKPVTRALLTRACEVYCDLFTTKDGRIDATFEIVTLTAWVPHQSQQQPLKPGSAKTRLADALAAKEYSTDDKSQ